ncbi:NPCBM/NEW2 domain-containing protein [Humibacter ginsenosidimutans]|uniref:DUF5110 domain-containing protein n=1 Tax=Humibacter ginsenosidimutans TaxID=2599293 RepID=A0A5B8M9A2_9MICO|nr:NPCBM/NEW2 domain-containing protein [Humibacter ginsenosidimutans]QDZ16205.1 DUF5110 domain-containing protein [Humibacter ginsenosidimutans]
MPLVLSRRRTVPAIVVAATLAFASLSATAAPSPAQAATGTQPDVPSDPSGTSVGAITDVAQKNAAVTLTAQNGAVRVTFLDANDLRIEADPSGKFTDPANTSQNDPARSANIVVGAGDFTAPTVKVVDGSTITISTSAVTLKIDKATARMELDRADGSEVWAESKAITFGSSSTTQHLAAQSGEQFLGGGMQNGDSIHTGKTINISKDYNWADGGHPNAVPYYMSSAGYGVLRDTFAAGSYTFTSDVTTTHAEKRFDAYYFVGDYKKALDGYTKLTGRPLMPPVYALEYGDSDCYNRSNPGYSSSGYTSADTPKQHTYDAVQTAKAFKDNDMPAGWMLVNDGYGCGYTQDPSPYDPSNPGQGLGGTVQGIKSAADLKTGLWTQSDLTNQQTEVGQDGIALRKLDVAWIGEGYRMALTGCTVAHDGIEQYSDQRGVALMVEGWAGAQRCGMQWTGDHTGSLDAIRWEVPAIAGSGNSGLAFTTADVDGIFGGSATSYVRDLQWKALSPALYSMSGWAPTDKRPWLYGDAATAINRQYLQLRQQMMPYIYTLAANAHDDGTPVARSMAIEFPNDPNSYGSAANEQYMLGSDLLVAPVYTDSDVRNGIDLPAGSNWIDYWTGKIYQGGQILNGYDAPLQTLPLFVKAGAVVPQGIVARNASLVPENSAITLDIYPSGTSTTSLYEDDKVTRDYENGDSATQKFTVTAPKKDAGDVTVTIGARSGHYDGMAASRPYQLDVHSGSAPEKVTVGSTTLPALADKAAFDAAATGWYYDANDSAGVVHVKAGSVASGDSATVTLKASSAVGGKTSDATAAEVAVTLDDQAFQGVATTATAAFTNTGDHAKTDVTIVPALPDGWTVKSATGDHVASVGAGETVTATFSLVPGSTSSGTQTVAMNATYTDQTGGKHTVKGANQLDVAYGSLAGAYNSVSVTTVDGRAKGDFDGGGATFSAEQLATAPTPAGGVTPGSTVTVDAGTPTQVDYTWPKAGPDVPDSVSMNGQTIALSGSGTHLAVLASAASASGVTPELTITYTDGSVQKQSLFFPNWLLQGSLGTSKVAVTSMGRNNATNANSPEYTTYKYQVYSNTVRLIPGKTLKSVTMPVATNVKVFDWKVVSFPLPDAPTAPTYASDLDWVSATDGYGVIGKDVANKDTATSPDEPLAINYTDPDTGATPTYTKGLGVHAASSITYYLGGRCTRFTADVGLQNPFTGNIIFTVDGDGQQLYQSRTFTPGFAPEHLNVDVTGVQYIDLDVDPTTAGNINGAHGVWGDAKFDCAPPDTTAPVTTAKLSGQPQASGWYTTTPSVSLTATDDTAVQTTQYKLGDGEWNAYSKPVAIADGTTSFAYRSTDAAGNTEDAKSLQLKVDTVPPTVTASVHDRSVTLKAEDATSGIHALEYSTDSGTTWKAYTKPIAGGDDGVAVLYRATDVAGNVTTASDPVVVAPKGGDGTTQPKLVLPRTVKAGSSFDIAMSNLPATTKVTVELHSTPVVLGSVTTDASGVATLRVTIPSDIELGTHTISVSAGDNTLATSAVTIVAADQPVGAAAGPSGTVASGSSLPSTGSDAVPLVAWTIALLAAGALVLLVARRRRMN